MKLMRITLWGELSYENVEWIPNHKVPPQVLDIFNNEQFIFRCQERLTHFVHRDSVSCIQMRRTRTSIPNNALACKGISISDDLTFSPAWVMTDSSLAPDIFGDDQITFIADNIVHVSQENKVVQIVI